MKFKKVAGGVFFALVAGTAGALAVDFSFEVYEMPRTTLDALSKYLDAGGDGAAAAYAKLAGMGGVTQLSALAVTTPSGTRVKADSGGKQVGDEAWMGVEGLNLEMDPVVGKHGEIDLNYVLKFLQAKSGKVAEYNVITSVSIPPDQPVVLQTWNEEAQARVLFVTATDAGDFQPELSDGAMLRVDLELVELGSSREAELLADKGDASAVEAARREGDTRLHHVMHARSGQRMQSRAGAGTSRQFPGEMDEYQLDLASTWGADRTEANVKMDFLRRKGGTEEKFGGGDMLVKMDGLPVILAVKAANGDATPYVALIRSTVVRVGTAEPKAGRTGPPPSSLPPSTAKDTPGFFTGTYSVEAGFMPDLEKKYFKDGRSHTAKEVLGAAGMAFPAGTSAFFNPQTGAIVLRQNTEGHKLMRELVKP